MAERGHKTCLLITWKWQSQQRLAVILTLLACTEDWRGCCGDRHRSRLQDVSLHDMQECSAYGRQPRDPLSRGMADREKGRLVRMLGVFVEILQT